MFIQLVHIRLIPSGNLETNGSIPPEQNFDHHLKLYFHLETARVRLDHVKPLLTDYTIDLMKPGQTS